jgi:hypothetical protein
MSLPHHVCEPFKGIEKLLLFSIFGFVDDFSSSGI